jgi:hypothetical protein
LGASIEHGEKKGTYPPQDYAKWARICEHIILHYTKGWANGFHYDITYWEIWNEPDAVTFDKDGNFVGDNKYILRYEDDAAKQTLYGDWRMPSVENFYELFYDENCIMANVTYNGVKGLQFTSKKNGNSIFLPYTGVIADSEVIAHESLGTYWTNSLADQTQYAYCYTFFGADSKLVEPRERYVGCPIRPVLP